MAMYSCSICNTHGMREHVEHSAYTLVIVDKFKTDFKIASLQYLKYQDFQEEKHEQKKSICCLSLLLEGLHDLKQNI